MAEEEAPLLFEETSREERLAVRRALFAHQDGLAFLPVLAALRRHGVLQALAGGASSCALGRELGARPGPFHVALRALASQGWLEGWSAPRTPGDLDAGMDLRMSAGGLAACRLLEGARKTLAMAEAFLPAAEKMEGWLLRGESAPESAPDFAELLEAREQGWGLPPAEGDHEAAARERLGEFFDGLIAGPLLVTLTRNGLVRREGSGREIRILPHLDEGPLEGDEAARRLAEEVPPALAALGWMRPDAPLLTRMGRAAAFVATAYGVTLSYLPLLRQADAMTFGNTTFRKLFPRTAEGAETHVDRRLNIWGSGGAHELYFRKVDEVIEGLFSRPDPPRAVCDTGCGDGSFLVHMAEVLRDRLGWDFERNPVWFLGSDLNGQARALAAETLRAAAIPQAAIIDEAIDINYPDELAAGIERLGLEVIGSGGPRPLTAADALHTNSMLVHNRRYLPPESVDMPESGTDGAFVDGEGGVVPGRVLQQNLVEFLGRWEPYVRRYGWLFIELHTLATGVVAEDPGRTPTLAYDLTHGFSNQYTVERPELLAAARLAGLREGPAAWQAEFPEGARARVSVNYLLGGG